MTYQSNHFDLIIDKSTMDCILTSDQAQLDIALMVSECQRTLKPGGIYATITFGEPETRLCHFKSNYLSFNTKVIPIKQP